MKKVLRYIAFCSLFLIPNEATAQQIDSQKESVVLNVDARHKIEPMKTIWAWFGYDEPNYTYMKDGQKLLTELAELSYVPVNVRAHNLLNTGDGTAALKWGSTNAYTEDKKGNPIYDWTITDKIFDTYVYRGMKPLVEIGFMPEALSTNPQPYRHSWTTSTQYNSIFTGWTTPPKDYDKWRELVYQWVKHCITRYGENEVASWYWEVWNEPDIGYWSGTFDEYCKLYDYSADGVKKALPRAKIGGPETTDPSNKSANEFLRKFLDHCRDGINYATGEKGSPLDFISFHAKGSPQVVDGHVRMNLGRQLRNIDKGFEAVASYPEFKKLPIIIGESDPEGCAACSVEHHPQNAYRNGTMYSSYSAAAFARTYELARKHGVNLAGAVSWAFEFEDQPWFAGFRDLATNGVDKPVLNLFRMFGMMSGSLISVESSRPMPADELLKRSVREEADINAIASASERDISVMVWNYHDDDLPAEEAEVTVNMRNVSRSKVLVTEYRIDDEYSNAYEVWKAMGSPQNPSDEQIRILQESGQLKLYTSPAWRYVSSGKLTLKTSLPRQGVTLLRLTW